MLAVLERFAVQAGHEILDVRKQHFEVENKPDGSPVTLADQRAEKVIVSGLLRAFPDVPIVAEELVSVGEVPSALGRIFFLVDALDGTREFCAGRDEFTVNIAVIQDSVPVVGVVYSPALKVMYAGEHDGSGVCLAQCCKVSSRGEFFERRVIKTRAAPERQTIVATRSHMTDETRAYLEEHPEAELRNIGSSLKFCLLAEGKADLYPRFGTTMEWDTAAGDAVLRAAGGHTRTLDGNALTYGKRGQSGMADFQNPFFVSRGG